MTAKPRTNDQILSDLQIANEQLLLAGLREHTQADQLRRQLAFATAITTSLGEGVIVLDAAGCCTFANPAAEQILGWTSDELRGRAIDIVFPARAAQREHHQGPNPISTVLHTATIQRDENASCVHRDGRSRPTAYCAAPIITNDQVVGAVITFRDMSEMRRLQQTREEYLELISHDLRAPLTAIMGRAQILLHTLTQQGLAKEARSARVVVESTLRMNHMIEDLLDRSRADGILPLQQRAITDLALLVNQILNQTIAPDDQERFVIEASTRIYANIDQVQIARVIANLLSNAQKFSLHATPIRIRLFLQASEAILAITDQGVGIAPEDMPRLFEKHYRAQTAEQIMGRGLGLYASRMIITEHGGRIWAESTLGVGSTFTVVLPLVSKQ